MKGGVHTHSSCQCESIGSTIGNTVSFKKCNDTTLTYNDFALTYTLCGICRKQGEVMKRRRRRRQLIRKGRPCSSGSRAKRITEQPAELAGIAGYSYTSS